MLTIHLPEEMESQLKALAKATGKTEAYYVRKAVIEYLNDLADVHIAEKRLEDIRAGRVKTIPLEEVLSHYGLDSKA